MKIDITRVSEEKKDDEFWKQHALFQRECKRKDVREKFRLSLHEAGHILYLRRAGWTVKLLGPWMDFADGELRAANGGVKQVNGGRPLLDWEVAKKSVAGFVLVEELTGQPNEQTAIDGDIRVLSRETKTTDERLQKLIEMGKILVLCDLRDPAFVRELEVATREYEFEIFNTDETWDWAVKEFQLHRGGERYSVGCCSTGGFGMLLERGDSLNLFVDGIEYEPHEKLNYCEPTVVLCEPGRKCAAEAVGRWNARVRAFDVSRGGAVESSR